MRTSATVAWGAWWICFTSCGPPSVPLPPATTHRGAVLGSNATDLWLGACAGSDGPFHWDGHAWKTLSIAAAPCSPQTLFSAAGPGAIWYLDSNQVKRLHVDGTAEDFTNQLPVSITPFSFGSRGSQAVVLQRFAEAPGMIAEQGFLFDGTGFSELPRLPLLAASVTMRSPTDIWAFADDPPRPGLSQMVHFDGAGWTQLPTEGISGVESIEHLDRTFETGDLWARGTTGDGPDGLTLYRWDGHWHLETLPFASTPKLPANAAGHDLDLSFIARSQRGKLAAWGVYSPVDASGGHQPVDMSGSFNSTYWALEWDGAKWTRATEMATVIRCVGPGCGSDGYQEGSELDDGTIVLGNGNPDKSALLLLRY